MLFRGRQRALYRKSLRNQLPGSKIALNAAPRALHPTELVLRHYYLRSCYSDCANARLFSRAEFTRTTPSYGRVAS